MVEPQRPLLGPLEAAVQPQQDQEPFERCGVLVEDRQLLDAEDLDVEEADAGPLLGQILDLGFEVVEVLGLPPVERLGLVQPLEEPVQLGDVVLAVPHLHRPARALGPLLRQGPHPPVVEEFLAALEVERGERPVGLAALDAPGLLDLQVAEGGQHRPVRGGLQGGLLDVLDIGVEGLVQRLGRPRDDVREGQWELLLLMFDGNPPEVLSLPVDLRRFGHEVDHRVRLPKPVDPRHISGGVEPLGWGGGDLDPARRKLSCDPQGFGLPTALGPLRQLESGVQLLQRLFVDLLQVRPEFLQPEVACLRLVEVDAQVERLLDPLAALLLLPADHPTITSPGVGLPLG